MQISEIMTVDPACCLRTDTVQNAAILMRELNIGIVPIVSSAESHRLVGVVTDRDLCIDVVAAGKDVTVSTLEPFMTTELVTCHPDDEVESVAHLMQSNQIRRIPVVDDDFRLKGIVSTADMVLCGDLPAAEVDETMRDISEPTFDEFHKLGSLHFMDNPIAGDQPNA
jgi:CBS domain-containing protein